MTLRGRSTAAERLHSAWCRRVRGRGLTEERQPAFDEPAEFRVAQRDADRVLVAQTARNLGDQHRHRDRWVFVEVETASPERHGHGGGLDIAYAFGERLQEWSGIAADDTAAGIFSR